MKNGIIPLLVFIAILLPLAAQADMGPKPTVDVDVTYAGGNVSDAYFYAVMLACMPEDGYGAQYGLPDYAPQLNITLADAELNCSWRPGVMVWSDSNGGRGNCHDSRCSFRYNPPRTFRLAVYLPGQNTTFISNASTRTSFNSHYLLSLQPDGSAEISETTLLPESGFLETVLWFIPAAFITLAVELALGLLLAIIAKFRMKRFLLSVLLANLLSLPVVWFVFPLLGNALLVVPLAEAFAVAFEAVVIHLLGRRTVSLKMSLLISLILNAASLLAGAILLLPLWLFLKLFF